MKYGVVIEKVGNNYAAYVPDLPGCAVTGLTVSLVESAIRKAIRFHLSGLKEDGKPLPQPTSIVAYVEA